MSHISRRSGWKAAAAVIATLALAAAAAQEASAAGTCDLVAAPTGSPTALGTEADPLRGALALIASLDPGQTGCLRGGTYSEDEFKISNPNVTLTSFPGERAKLVGRMWIAKGADGVAVTDLDLDGRNSRKLPSPTVNAADTTFSDNDVTNGHTAICFNLGHPSFGSADRTTIERNRIHDCGALPATNHDHGIYVSEADDTVIRGNLIYDNADRGIQLYPDSQGARITGNVIDGNGQGIIFGGDSASGSSNNLVENNVITNSTIRYNVESSWVGPVGTGNVVRNNCINGGIRDSGNGGIQSPGTGFTAVGNISADPGYADRGSGDFTMDPGSQCGQMMPGGAPPASDLQVEGSLPVRLSLKSNNRKAQRGNKVGLTGRAVNLKRVEIEVKRNGAWSPVKHGRVQDNRFQVRVRAQYSGLVRYRARSALGGEASRPVHIRVVS